MSGPLGTGPSLTPAVPNASLRIRPLGDRAVVAELGAWAIDGTFRPAPPDSATSERTIGLAAAIREALGPAARDVVPAYRSVLIEYDPDRISVAELERLIGGCVPDETSELAAARRTVTIPVCYGGEFGPDLDDVAAQADLTLDEVVAAHAGGTDYRVAFLGFSPGYAYLHGLPPRLATPRLASPRPRVPAGSVAIGGAQTAVYPQATPGGWRLIGQTAVPLFDVDREPAALLAPGDRVVFRAVDPAEHGEIAGQVRAGRYEPEVSSTATGERVPFRLLGRPIAPAAPPISMNVISPGLLTTVQDRGRPGFGAQGITPGGAQDRAAHFAANRLVGNDPGAAVLEMTLTGPTLRPNRPVTVALTGAHLGATVDGRPAPHWEPFVVPAGGTLSFPPALADRAGLRGYLAVAGGIDVPLVLASRATDLTGGFGGLDGRPLVAGDRLPVGTAPIDERVLGMVVGQRPRIPAGVVSLRVVVGPHDDLLADGDLARLLGEAFIVTSRSDQMGVRLAGPALRVTGAGDLVSEGMVTGTVQLPADGQLIILLAGHGTVGGYAKVAAVIDADLDLASQLRPGTAVRFRAVTLAEAAEAGRRYREALGWLSGQYDDQVLPDDRVPSRVARAAAGLLEQARAAIASAPASRSDRIQ